MRPFLAMLLVLACASCAELAAGSTTPTATTAKPVDDAEAEAAEAEVEEDCDEEAPTGSHIVRNVCRTAKQKKEARRKAEELLRRPHQGQGTLQ